MREWAQLFLSPEGGQVAAAVQVPLFAAEEGGPDPARPGGSTSAIGPAAAFTCAQPRGKSAKSATSSGRGGGRQCRWASALSQATCPWA